MLQIILFTWYFIQIELTTHNLQQHILQTMFVFHDCMDIGIIISKYDIRTIGISNLFAYLIYQ